MSSGGSFSITAYRPEQNEAEDVFDRLEVDSDDESFSQPAGIPCTATGVPLTEETATKTAEAYVFSPPQDAFVALAVSGPWPQNHLDKVLLLLHHPSIDVHAAAVKELVLLTAETDKRRRQAGEARVAAFSHLTRLSMLLASEDTQVTEPLQVLSTPDGNHQKPVLKHGTGCRLGQPADRAAMRTVTATSSCIFL